MNSGCAPQRVFPAHPLDQITQAPIDLRTPCPLSGFPAPESFEALAMPPEDRLRLNHLSHTKQARPELGHPYGSARSLPRSRRRGGACRNAILS